MASEVVGVTVNGQSSSIMSILVLGAGTDYALLLVARYREELRHEQDKHAALANALSASGPAIVASALTVIAGAAVPHGRRGERHRRPRAARRDRRR